MTSLIADLLNINLPGSTQEKFLIFFFPSVFNCLIKTVPLDLSNTTALVDLQLDAQNSYLFTYNTLIKILYMFRALPCSSSGGLCRNCIYAASGIVTVCKK
jgi:hypothetical protein